MIKILVWFRFDDRRQRQPFYDINKLYVFTQRRLEADEVLLFRRNLICLWYYVLNKVRS